MASRQHKPVFCDQRNDLFHFRQKLAVSSDADKGTVFVGIPDLVFGIERGHPDKAPPSAGYFRHVVNRGGIDSADGQIQIDTAEDFYAGNFLAHDERPWS